MAGSGASRSVGSGYNRSVRMPLPIDAVIDSIIDSLRAQPALVLKAPPGAGKTTRVPPALLDRRLASGGRGITVLEPRRLAARTAAARVAAERGGALGEEIGYRVRFEAAVSPRTRITFVTEGVMVRRLLADPLLADTAAVVLDEFHERSAQADLILSFLRELQETVRPDLRVVVMSATLDPSPISRFLGGCPVIESEGRVFDVQVEHETGLGNRPMEARAAEAAARLIAAEPLGSVLVFMPGASEIRRTMQLAGPMAAARGFDLCPLHGDLPSEEQDRAVRAGRRPRLVVATNVAEASVTVEGVTGVVDSGLARVSRRDPRSGLNRLATVRISRSSARQRAGRAGRVAPGRCVRLFTAAEFAARPETDEPEIRRIDLAEILLAQLAWAERDPFAFSWLDAPEPRALRRSLELLRQLGAIERASPDDCPALSADGRAMLRWPLHPRLGRILVESERRGCRGEAATLVALLSERDIRLQTRVRFEPDREDVSDAGAGGTGGVTSGGAARASGGFEAEAPSVRAEAATRGSSDLLERRDDLEAAARLRFEPAAVRALGVDRRAALRVWRVAEQVRGRTPRAKQAVPEEVLLRCLLSGYPDRIVRRREPAARDGLMVGGVGARLDEASVVRDGEFYVALEAAPCTGGSGRLVAVRQASLARREWLEDLDPGLVREEDQTEFDPGTGRVVGLRRRLFLDLVLDERTTGSVDPAKAAELLHLAASRSPADAIALSPDLARWFARVRWLLGVRPELAASFPAGEAPAPVSNDPVVEATGPLWPWVLEELRPLCLGRRSLSELRDVGIEEVLSRSLPGDVAAALASLAPERLTLPSGRAARLEYRPADPPILAARVQEFFGSTETPRVGAGTIPVLLHLLAPSFRPVQVTTDLRSFWATVYPKIRVELRRRYPRHAWPDDPLTAAPLSGPRRREAKAEGSPSAPVAGKRRRP